MSEFVKRLRTLDGLRCPTTRELEAAARIEALEADGREATRLLDLWSEIPGAEDFAPYQDTMTFLGKPNSAGWVWARQVREERDFDKEQARQRDLAMQCVCEAEEREQAAHARIEALEAMIEKMLDADPATYRIEALEAALREAIDELRWHDAVAAANKASAALAPEQER